MQKTLPETFTSCCVCVCVCAHEQRSLLQQTLKINYSLILRVTVAPGEPELTGNRHLTNYLVTD